MMRRVALLLGLTAGLAPTPVCAVELPYTVKGDVAVGYRNVDVDGSDAKYREDYNYRTGFRLFDLNVDGVAKDPAASRLDRFHLQIDTPGNEPVSTFRLTASDRTLYDFRVNFIRSKYYYAVPELWQEPVAGDVRLDDLHQFNTLRWNGSADLTLRLPHVPTLFFGYRLYKVSGGATSTVLIPGGDTFVVNAPVDSITNVGKVGTEFRALGTSVFLQQEYRRITRTFDQDGPRNPEGVDPTDASTMSQWLADQPEHIDQPATTVRLRRPIGEKVDLTGAYFYSHADLTSAASFYRDGTSNAPAYSGVATSTDRGSATLDTHVVDLGVTGRISPTLAAHATYRFNERSQNGSFDQTSTYGDLNTGTSDLVKVQTLTGDLEWQPRRTLLLRAGLRYAFRDAYFSLTDERTQTDTLGAIGEARWRPWSALDLFARYENTQVNDPLVTAGDSTNVPPLPSREIQLTFVNRGSAGVRLRPRDWIAVNYQFICDDQSNDTFDASWQTFANSVSVTLTPLPNLNFFAGYTHRDIDNRSDIYYAPLYARSLSIQQGSEDIFTTELQYDFGLFGQQWSVGGNVAYINASNRLAPNLEPGLSGYALYDLDRIDGGGFLTWRAKWFEPSIEFRRIDYNQPAMPANDYRATILLFKIRKAFDF